MRTPPRLRHVSSPISPTPQRHPSPPPLHSSNNSSPISSPCHLWQSPSPPLLSPWVSTPSADIARQIAAVTQDLADLRAEERRLLRAPTQPRTAHSQQRVRRITIAVMPLVSSVSLTPHCTRMLHWSVLPPPLPGIPFSTFCSSRKNASGAASFPSPRSSEAPD